MQKYSVLMSVYAKENPDYFKASIESIMKQTILTDDFVIVCDGQLSTDLEEVIASYTNSYPALFQILRFKEQRGLGPCLNSGIMICKNELIARMDSDDIAVPERMELLLNEFEKDSDLAVCGGQIAEFFSDPKKIETIRKVPCEYEDIKKYAIRRNPMNHMTVMYKKVVVEAVGNYIKKDFSEDYYLWVRMLLNGYYMKNVNTILVKARIGNGMFERRGGIKYAISMGKLMIDFYKLGFLSKVQLINNILIRVMMGILPNKLRKFVYIIFLRA